MCTLVVFGAADNTVPGNPVKDQRGCWKRGMVVCVYEDGVCVEAPSPKSKMVFVHIPGVTKAQAEKYLESNDERRRVYKIDWATLPNAAKNSLRDTRELTVTLNQVKKYIRNIATNALEG